MWITLRTKAVGQVQLFSQVMGLAWCCPRTTSRGAMPEEGLRFAVRRRRSARSGVKRSVRTSVIALLRLKRRGARR